MTVRKKRKPNMEQDATSIEERIEKLFNFIQSKAEGRTMEEMYNKFLYSRSTIYNYLRMLGKRVVWPGKGSGKYSDAYYKAKKAKS